MTRCVRRSGSIAFELLSTAISSSADGKAPCYTIRFIGAFNGRIGGTRVQCIASNATGTPVEAIPRSGFTFDRWSDGNRDNPRTISNPQADATIRARYRTDGVKTVWLGHSFIRWNLELLYDVAKNDVGYSNHEDYMTFAPGAGGAPGSLWADSTKREEGQDMIQNQRPDNVVLTYHFRNGTSDYIDYQRWVDFTIDDADLPDVRFYIALPWRAQPEGGPRLPALISQTEGEDIESEYQTDWYPAFKNSVLDQLRTDYPSNEFIIIPQMVAAGRIQVAHFDGTLTYGSSSSPLDIRRRRNGTLSHEQCIYDDRTGHPGGPLRLLTMALYLRYIYGSDIGGLQFWEDKQSFSNVGLVGVGPRMSMDAGYSYYNGYDFAPVADDMFKQYRKGN